MSREMLLAYPDFNTRFMIHTDASHKRLGAVILPDNRPIAFYSRKLNPAQASDKQPQKVRCSQSSQR
jgi:hypothetical protein